MPGFLPPAPNRQCAGKTRTKRNRCASAFSSNCSVLAGCDLCWTWLALTSNRQLFPGAKTRQPVPVSLRRKQSIIQLSKTDHSGAPNKTMPFSWIVSQIGARQHYGVPRGFFYKNELRTLYTEVWCRWGHSLLRRGPKPARAFAGRYHPDIPNSKVVAFDSSV